MLDDLKERVTTVLAHVVVGSEPQAPPPPPLLVESHEQVAPMAGDVALAEPAVVVKPYRPEEIDPARPDTWVTTPRNAPCPCGSGRKYKYCHGKV